MCRWQIFAYEPALPLFAWRDLKEQNILKMNNIQKIIKVLEDEKENAQKIFLHSKHRTKDESYEFGKLYAFSLCIQKLTLLLNTEKAKQRSKRFSK